MRNPKVRKTRYQIDVTRPVVMVNDPKSSLKIIATLPDGKEILVKSTRRIWWASVETGQPTRESNGPLLETSRYSRIRNKPWTREEKIVAPKVEDVTPLDVIKSCFKDLKDEIIKQSRLTREAFGELDVTMTELSNAIKQTGDLNDEIFDVTPSLQKNGVSVDVL